MKNERLTTEARAGSEGISGGCCPGGAPSLTMDRSRMSFVLQEDQLRSNKLRFVPAEMSKDCNHSLESDPAYADVTARKELACLSVLGTMVVDCRQSALSSGTARGSPSANMTV